MRIGVLIALLSYSIYSVSDSILKSFGSATFSAFELNFLLNLFALVALPFARQPGEQWRDVFRFRHPWLMNGRALLQTAAALCFTVALTRIPFAETYSLVFLTPLFLSLLSVLLLKEHVAITRWLLVGASFVGVLVVVRPGFRELHWGHLTAVASAAAGATSTTILRVVSGREAKLSIVAMNGAYQIIGAGILMAFTFIMLSPMQLFRLLCIGVFGGTAQLFIITALQRSPASHIAPLQYSQIIWAVIFGSIFYFEFPDYIGVMGLVVVVLSGLATVFADGARTRVAGRWAEFRARREGPKFTEVEGPEI